MLHRDQKKIRLFIFLKFNDGQFYDERLKIIFHDDISFSDQLIAVIKVAKPDFRAWLRVCGPVDGVADDDIIGKNGYRNDERCLFVEFVMLDGILYQALQ